MKLLPIPKLNRRTFDIMAREKGVLDTLRFSGQLGLGTGDYTE